MQTEEMRYDVSLTPQKRFENYEMIFVSGEGDCLAKVNTDLRGANVDLYSSLHY